MRTREGTDVYELAREIDEELSEHYSGEEFFQKSKRIFLEHGYFVDKGTERNIPAYSRDFNLEGDHSEYSAEVLEYDDGPGPINIDSTEMRFILEDGRQVEDGSRLLYGDNTELVDLPERETRCSRGVV